MLPDRWPCAAVFVALLGAGLLLPVPAVSAPLAGPVVTDPSIVNVCERVPGAEVARVLGRALRSERPVVSKQPKLSRCVYILGPPGKPDAPTEGLVLWLYAPNEYAELNSITEGKLAPVPGLGDEAVRFLDPGDGRHKLRLLRRGRFALEATAGDAQSALTLARLALQSFDR
jgi:hypothetical protein